MRREWGNGWLGSGPHSRYCRIVGARGCETLARREGPTPYRTRQGAKRLHPPQRVSPIRVSRVTSSQPAIAPGEAQGSSTLQAASDASAG